LTLYVDVISVKSVRGRRVPLRRDKIMGMLKRKELMESMGVGSQEVRLKGFPKLTNPWRDVGKRGHETTNSKTRKH